VFCRADKGSVKELNNVIKKLQENTGLMVNKEKKKAYFNKSCQIKTELASLLGISISTMLQNTWITSLHFLYLLGLPLSISYIKARHFTPLIDNCRSKIEDWMLQKLSFAGRAELIKSVLHNTLSYWAMSFKFPVSVIRELESLFSTFLWNGKMHAWSWQDMQNKSRRGFGH